MQELLQYKLIDQISVLERQIILNTYCNCLQIY